MVKIAFPNVHFTVEDLIAEGGRVAARWQMEGTNLGPFAGFPASERRARQTAIVIYQISDAKIVRAWLQNDRLGLLQQIGAIPELAAAAPKN
jgi:predicted ester cyclase